jgi:hypothetical protein
MGKLQQPKNDVFLSYAHVDNISEDESEKGWVERFERALRVRLLKLFGEDVSIWQDARKLGRAQDFDDEIKDALDGSRVLVALISNRYLKSDYCKLEIDTFDERVGDRTAGRRIPRVFPVLLYNIAPEKWPAACQGKSGFKFHDAEDDDPYAFPLEPGSKPFERALRELVKELHRSLNQLQEVESAQEEQGAHASAASVAPTPSASAPAQPPSGSESQAADAADFNVFLATPADDLRSIWGQLAASLRREGVGVLDPVPPPYDEAGHTEKAAEAAKRADLSVHMLSSFPGAPIDPSDMSRTYPVEQTRLALDHSQSQLILRPEDMKLEDVEDEAYAEFMASLDGRRRDSDRLEVAAVGRHQMLNIILDKKRKIEEARRQRASARSGLESVFVDLHTDDLSHAGDLVNFLSERSIAPIMVPSADLSPSSGMSIFEENLKRTRLFLIVFGSVARDWVVHRLQEAFKLSLAHSLQTHIGVYVAPPTDKSADALRFPPYFDVALNMGGFDPTTIEPLLQKAEG